MELTLQIADRAQTPVCSAALATPGSSIIWLFTGIGLAYIIYYCGEDKSG
jgi:hypothetical protein